MTRVLSELLGAREPAFHQGLRRLEQASGHSGADIRLTSELERALRAKLKELGLDPQDTTGEELYNTLQQRIRQDDTRLVAALKRKYGSASHIEIAAALAELPVYKSCFALKASVMKQLMHKLPPKQTIKALGFRSFDSMARREPLVAVYAAAWLLESQTWRKAILEAYKKLKPSDFEIRQLAILAPHSTHWQKLAEVVVTQKKHNVVSLRECGAVVLLPMPKKQPPAAVLAALLIALREINEVRSGSTYLKLCQVRPDFGECLRTVVAGEPMLSADLLEDAVPWPVVQRYYARFNDRFRPDIFEPHIQQEDLSWHSIEKALAYIDPNLAFWQHTASLGFQAKPQPVSLNVIDVTLNFCNQLPYRRRLVAHFRGNLWNELTIRYLKHEGIEEAVTRSLGTKLAGTNIPQADEFDAV